MCRTQFTTTCGVGRDVLRGRGRNTIPTIRSREKTQGPYNKRKKRRSTVGDTMSSPSDDEAERERERELTMRQVCAFSFMMNQEVD